MTLFGNNVIADIKNIRWKWAIIHYGVLTERENLDIDIEVHREKATWRWRQKFGSIICKPRMSKWSESLSVLSNSLRPHVHVTIYSPWNSLGQNTRMGNCSFLQGNLPNPGIKPRSPTLQVNSLQGEPPGKRKNTGVGSLSFLRGILLTYESNWDLLQCRHILYQLNYQGSPKNAKGCQ